MTADTRVFVRCNQNSNAPRGLVAIFPDSRETIYGRDALDLLLALDRAGVARDSLVVELPDQANSDDALALEQYARLRHHLGQFPTPARTEADLKERYPALLFDVPMPAVGQYWVPSNWIPVLEALCDQLQADAEAKHEVPPQIAEIKPKHTELRVRLKGQASERQRGMLDLVARMTSVLDADRMGHRPTPRGIG